MEPAARAARPDEPPRWKVYGLRVLGCIGAISCMALGVLACITIFAQCLLAGILQILLGFILALNEAACLFVFVDFAQRPSKFFENKPLWYRSILYIVLSLLIISMCPGISTIFGAGLAFVIGVLYAVMAFGKKTPVEQQARNENDRF